MDRIHIKQFIRVRTAILQVAFLTISLVAVAQKTDPAEMDTGRYAKIEFADTVHDYGIIKKGSDGICEFTFVNTGNVPLILANVKATCGCTNPVWSKEPVLPGKKGKITVQYYTTSRGRFLKYVIVTSNAVNPKVILKIQGVVK